MFNTLSIYCEFISFIADQSNGSVRFNFLNGEGAWPARAEFPRE